MIIRNMPALHLTYCLNVHPGETWEENLAAIRTHTLAVRDQIAPGRTFGLGLRLSRRAAETLGNPEVLADFKAFLSAENLYSFTINGFPMARFTGNRSRPRFTVRIGPRVNVLITPCYWPKSWPDFCPITPRAASARCPWVTGFISARGRRFLK